MAPQRKRLLYFMAAPCLFLLAFWGASLAARFHPPLLSHGMLPRSLPHLYSLFTSPFIQNSLFSLFTQSLLFLLLWGLCFALKSPSSWLLLPCLALGQGLLQWLLAPSAFYLGPGGLLAALYSYLLFLSLSRKEIWLFLASLPFWLFFGHLVQIVEPQLSGHWLGFMSSMLPGLLVQRCLGNFKTQTD